MGGVSPLLSYGAPGIVYFISGSRLIWFAYYTEKEVSYIGSSGVAQQGSGDYVGGVLYLSGSRIFGQIGN